MPDMTLRELHTELHKTFGELTTRLDQQDAEIRKAGAAPGDLTETIKRIETDLTELRKDYTEIVAKGQRPKVAGQAEPGSPEQELRKQAFVKFVRYGFSPNANVAMTPEESRALSSASDAEGGFLVPLDFESQILMAAFNMAEIRPIANVGTTGRDAVFQPALSQPTMAWGRRNVAVSPQTLSAGGERLEIFPLQGLCTIHNDTLEDPDADIMSELMQQFPRAIAQTEDTAFAAGAGDDSPQGVVADSRVQALYKASGVAAALSDGSHNGIDALTTAFYALKKTYRANSTWAFNSTTEGVIRKLKDGNGQYYWTPPVQLGAPPTLLGRPIVNPEGMPDIGAGTYPIVIGDFMAGYKIRDRSGIVVQRLVELYAAYGQTGFLVKRRTGGMVVQAEAFVPVKIST